MQRFIPLLFLLLLTTMPVSAHSRVELDEGYAVVVGWINEPALLGERNAVAIEITQNDEPLSGVEATLDARLLYAGNTFTANLNPTEHVGLYAVPVIPTVRGQYEIQLFGTIGELEVDFVAEPEEILPASRLQFPEKEPSILELQEQVNQLESQVGTARLFGLIGIVVGLLGCGLAGYAFLKKAS